MKDRSFRRVCTLLLALVLAVMPFSGLNNPAQAMEIITDPSVPMPWGVRWTSNYTVEWHEPYNYTDSQELYYNVKLVIYSSARGSNIVNSIEFLAVKGYRFSIPKENFYSGNYYYQVQVTTVKPTDGQYCSPYAYTERVRGTELANGHVSPGIEYLDGTIELRVNETITAENRIHLDIDREDYLKPDGMVPAYEQVQVFGDFPEGVEWKYGEADTPYIFGTPTEIGVYSSVFIVHLETGDNLLFYLLIKVLPESMWSDEDIVIEKGIEITPFVPTFSYEPVFGFGVSEGTLPPGLELTQTDSSAEITGTPTKSGLYSVVLNGYDQWQNEYYDLISFLVTEFFGSYSDTWDLYLGKEYDFVLPQHIDGQYYSVELTAGHLPEGMDWSRSEEKGVQISGTPKEAGFFEAVFRVTNAKGQYTIESMYINVINDVEPADLYEVDLTGPGSQLDIKKAEYEEILKGTLDAAVRGQQIQYEESDMKINGLTVTVTQYDLDTDNQFDIMVTPSENGYILSLMPESMKEDDFFLDLNEASVYAAQHQSGGYALTLAFRVNKPALMNPFEDVLKDNYYYDPILWAFHHDPQITKGLTTTQFGIDEKCTRAQIVTFLWRAAGCPEPSKETTDFQDVDLSSWYGKAVLWAVDEGITSGISKTEFNPDGDCTRAQVVTFLFRYAGEPDTTSPDCDFKDLDYSQYYINAVMWAVKYKITKGTGEDTFGPYDPCTRSQIVTFLYRLLYSHNVLDENDFLMYVDNLSSNGGEYSFQGTVTNGSVRFGSRIRILSYKSNNKNSAFEQEAVVSRIMVIKNNQYTDVREAEKGQSAVVYIDSLSFPDHVRKGDALAGINSDICQVDTKVCGTVTMEPAADPDNELREKMKPSLFVSGDVTGTVSAIPGGELKNGQTGENVLWTDFQRPVVFYVGQEVAIRKAGKLCGQMKITQVGP